MKNSKQVLKKRDIFKKTSEPEHILLKLVLKKVLAKKNEYEGSFAVFDDKLAYNQKTIDPFFAEGREKNRCLVFLLICFSIPQKKQRK